MSSGAWKLLLEAHSCWRSGLFWTILQAYRVCQWALPSENSLNTSAETSLGGQATFPGPSH